MMVVGNENTEAFRQWNQKMVNESAKMIKLVLVLLIGWMFLAIGWIVNLILMESSHSSETYLRFARGEHGASAKTFEQLSFFTIVNHDIKTENDWGRIKMIIGGFHQLKEDSGQVPVLTIYTKSPLDDGKRAESLPWNKVEFKVISNSNEMIPSNGHQLSNIYNDRIWISSEYTFDPIALDLRKADLLGETALFKEAFSKGRRLIESIGNEECLKLFDYSTRSIVLKTPCTVSNSIFSSSKVSNYASEYGFKRIENASKSLDCHVDLREEILENAAELVDFSDFRVLEQLDRSLKKKKLAIAVPTTSKGMAQGEKHVLLTALIPSLNSTLTRRELKEFEIVLFIGYDKGDAYFEGKHNDFRREIAEYGLGIKVIFLRLAPFKRVAMTWNMIFQFSRKHALFDYYYQVNDDLRMVTPGWLTKFSTALIQVGNVGVAGPSDNFNGFACSLLTQSFVSDLHFQIFGGFLYPLEFRDWKSDRWLSFVYGPARTFCWESVEANNGAKATRYEFCQVSEWKIYLEKGRAIIKAALGRVA